MFAYCFVNKYILDVLRMYTNIAALYTTACVNLTPFLVLIELSCGFHSKVDRRGAERDASISLMLIIHNNIVMFIYCILNAI